MIPVTFNGSFVILSHVYLTKLCLCGYWQTVGQLKQRGAW